MSEASDLVSRVAEEVAAQLTTQVYVALRYIPSSATNPVAIWIYAALEDAQEGCQKNAGINRLGTLTWSKNVGGGWSSQSLTSSNGGGACRFYIYPREVL